MRASRVALALAASTVLAVVVAPGASAEPTVWACAASPPFFPPCLTMGEGTGDCAYGRHRIFGTTVTTQICV